MKNPLHYIARAAAFLGSWMKAKINAVFRPKIEIITVDPFPEKKGPTRADLRREWRRSHGQPGDKIARLAALHRITVRNP